MPFSRKSGSVTLKELRTNPDEIAQRVRNGEIVMVIKRSQPLFRLIKPFEFPAPRAEQARSRIRRG